MQKITLARHLRYSVSEVPDNQVPLDPLNMSNNNKKV